MRRLHSLDGLRALAVLLVFAHHVDQRALPGGFIGVDVFFVLSGYLITFLLLREYDERGGIDLPKFYLRRLLRLYPALIVMVVAVAVASEIDHIGNPVPDSAAAVFYVTDFYANYTGGLSLLLHTWSLSVEEQFYLVWPILMLLTLSRSASLVRLVWGLILLSVLITFAVQVAHPPHITNIQFLPTSHIPELGAGILVALQIRAGPSELVLRLASAGPAAASICFLVISEVFWPSRWWVFPIDALVCWLPVAHLVLHHDSAVSRVFSARPLVWLGERSYAFYLWHYPILVFMLLHGVSVGARVAIGLPLTLAICAVSWVVVEQPFLRLKDRMRVAA